MKKIIKNVILILIVVLVGLSIHDKLIQKDISIPNKENRLKVINTEIIKYKDLKNVENLGIKKNQNLEKIDLKITNTTKKKLTYNLYNIQSFDKKNNILNVNSLYFDEDDGPIILSGVLKPNESIEGKIYFSLNDGQKIQRIILNNEQMEEVASVVL